MRQAVREAGEYWHYDHLVLQINSPGGELLALKALMHEARWWRERGGSLATEALLQAGSAAALALSLGDVGHRRVQPYTELLYHHSRLQTAGELHLTAQHAAAAQRRLRQVDDELIQLLVGHIALGFGSIETMASTGMGRCQTLSAHAESLKNVLDCPTSWRSSGRRGLTSPASLMLKRMEGAYQKTLTKGSVEPMIGIFAEVFDRDAPMPLAMAWGLLLIDAVDSVELLQPAHRCRHRLKPSLHGRHPATHPMAA